MDPNGNLYDMPSIYEGEELDEGNIMMMDTFEAVPQDVSGKEMLPEEDPTSKSFTMFDSADYDYEEPESNGGSNGFFQSPNFKSGIMTPDFWEMFDSSWGQKVQ